MAWKPRKGMPLSMQETAVLSLVARGLQAKDISHMLGIKQKTAETVKQNVQRKLGIGKAALLVHYALAHGIVENVYKCENQ